MLQEALRGGFYQIQHFFKAVGTTVVRIGDFGDHSVGSELKEEAHAVASVCGGSVVKDAKVLAIHGENEVEVFEVTRLDDARA